MLKKISERPSDEEYKIGIWKVVGYALYSLKNLELKVKLEFNASYANIKRDCKKIL